jgi:hypothetical protein
MLAAFFSSLPTKRRHSIFGPFNKNERNRNKMLTSILRTVHRQIRHAPGVTRIRSLHSSALCLHSSTNTDSVQAQPIPWATASSPDSNLTKDGKWVPRRNLDTKYIAELRIWKQKMTELRKVWRAELEAKQAALDTQHHLEEEKALVCLE